MTTARIVVVLTAAMTLAACEPAAEEAGLFLSPDRSSFDGAAERVVLKIRAFEVGGKPAGGVVRLTAPVGHFIGGDQAVLTDGFATATYACSPEEEAACAGTVRLAAEWAALHATTQVSIASALVVAPVDWEVVSTHSLSPLFAIASAGDGTAWAVGDRGAVLHLVGRQWNVVPSGVYVALRAVAIDLNGAPVIVGDDGVLLRQVDGALQQLPFPGKDSYRAVAVDSHGEVHVGSAKGILSTIVGDSIQPKLDLRTPILAMASQGDEVWATGDGMLARYAAAQWMNLPMPLTARLAVAQSGREGLWLGGEREGATSTSGVIVAGPSPGWRTTALPEPVFAFTEVPGVAERFALTSTKLYRQLGDAKWEAIVVPARATAMTSRSRGDLVLVGPPGFSLLRTP
ncbi:MAG: hypothetical protein Q8L48_28750 [Archangium sp.]|nr:hypothetical protein [Archangium sp.]